MGGGCAGGEEAGVKEDKARVVVGLKESVNFFLILTAVDTCFDFSRMKYCEFLNYILIKNLQINIGF
jgi:hypothetical protein